MEKWRISDELFIKALALWPFATLGANGSRKLFSTSQCHFLRLDSIPGDTCLSMSPLSSLASTLRETEAEGYRCRRHITGGSIHKFIYLLKAVYLTHDVSRKGRPLQEQLESRRVLLWRGFNFSVPVWNVSQLHKASLGSIQYSMIKMMQFEILSTDNSRSASRTLS